MKKWITRSKKYNKRYFSELTTLRDRLLVESTQNSGFLLLYENTTNILVGILNAVTAYTYRYRYTACECEIRMIYAGFYLEPRSFGFAGSLDLRAGTCAIAKITTITDIIITAMHVYYQCHCRISRRGRTLVGVAVFACWRGADKGRENATIKPTCP